MMGYGLVGWLQDERAFSPLFYALLGRQNKVEFAALSIGAGDACFATEFFADSLYD